jgi:hypothetical protein
MNTEIREILQYLENRDDYVIWAGFATFAYLGGKYSLDIDIFTDSLKTKEQISSDFQKKNWKIIPHDQSFQNWDKLKKHETTLDIVYSQNASKLFFFDKVRIKVYGNLLYFISKEALFLTKLGQLSAVNRTKEKRERDLKAIMELRKFVNVQKIRELVLKLPDSYWLTGWV